MRLYAKKLLPRAALDRMWTPGKGSYGFGWMIFPPHPFTFNARTVIHGGDINGFTSSMSLFPDRKGWVIVLSNVQGMQLDELTRGLSKMVLIPDELATQQ